jgi:tetratricopeptide (TPR) repeat protein
MLAWLVATPAFSQDPRDLAGINRAIADAQRELAKAQLEFRGLDQDAIGKAIERAQTDLKNLDLINPGIQIDIAGIKQSLAVTPFQVRIKSPNPESGQYEAGTRLLDDRKYDEAIQRFDKVIASQSDRADGALYWKAYALDRLGRRDDALAAIAALRRDHPNSRWLNDAAALQVEVNQNAGRPVSPGDESNEDIKLMAINGLMNADPDRAIPLLEGLLKGNASQKVKDRAMFVLTQNRSPRAQQILLDYAKGAGNPDLQIRAIRYIGMSGTPEARQQLSSVYSAASDAAVKREIIRSLMVSQARDPIFALAKTESEPSLRAEAIRQLGVLKAVDQLNQLYTSATAREEKSEIIRSFMVAGASDKLMDLAKNEKDPALRGEAIRNLSFNQSVSADTLTGLYSGGDAATKREVVNALSMRGDAKSLIALARKETDTSLKTDIVRRLSTMRNNKDVTDYMLELLK